MDILSDPILGSSPFGQCKENIKQPETSWFVTNSSKQPRFKLFFFSRELGNPRATGYGAGSQLLSVGTSRRKVMSIHRLW